MRSSTASGIAVQVAVMCAPQAWGRAAIEMCSGACSRVALIGREEASSGQASRLVEECSQTFVSGCATRAAEVTRHILEQTSKDT